MKDLLSAHCSPVRPAIHIHLPVDGSHGLPEQTHFFSQPSPYVPLGQASIENKLVIGRSSVRSSQGHVEWWFRITGIG